MFKNDIPGDNFIAFFERMGIFSVAIFENTIFSITI